MDLFFELDFHFVFLNVSVNFPKFGRLVVFNPFHCNILYFPLPIQFMLCRLGYLNLPTTWRLGGGGWCSTTHPSSDAPGRGKLYLSMLRKRSKDSCS
jgi:hypothetical protein